MPVTHEVASSSLVAPATKEALVFTKAFFVILFFGLERATSVASCRKIISPVEILLTEGADFVARKLGHDTPQASKSSARSVISCAQAL